MGINGPPVEQQLGDPASPLYVKSNVCPGELHVEASVNGLGVMVKMDPMFDKLHPFFGVTLQLQVRVSKSISTKSLAEPGRFGYTVIVLMPLEITAPVD